MTIQNAVNFYVGEAITIIEQRFGQRIRVDEVEVSNRMSRTLGLANWVGSDLCSRKYSIKISGKAFTEDSEMLRNTVRHEVAHVAEKQIFGSWGHGPNWKKIMLAMGEQPERLASKEKLDSIGFQYNRRKQSRYVVHCVAKGCEKEYKVTGRVHSNLTGYRCKCGNPLKSTGQTVKV